MKKQKVVRFALRAPADSYRRWQELASREGRSMNSQIRIVMDAYQAVWRRRRNLPSEVREEEARVHQ